MMEKKRPVGATILAIVSFLLILPACIMAILAGISGPPDKTIIDRVIRLSFMMSPLFFLSSGVLLLKYKKEAPSVYPDNTLVCPSCEKSYDSTWKICLKCGKPLVESNDKK